MFFTGFSAAANPTDTTHFNAYKAGAQAAADKRTIIIDTSGFPQMATSGTLPNGAASDSPDGTHPGPNLTAYLTGQSPFGTQQMKPLVIAALTAAAAAL